MIDTVVAVAYGNLTVSQWVSRSTPFTRGKSVNSRKLETDQRYHWQSLCFCHPQRKEQLFFLCRKAYCQSHCDLFWMLRKSMGWTVGLKCKLSWVVNAIYFALQSIAKRLKQKKNIKCRTRSLWPQSVSEYLMFETKTDANALVEIEVEVLTESEAKAKAAEARAYAAQRAETMALLKLSQREVDGWMKISQFACRLDLSVPLSTEERHRIRAQASNECLAWKSIVNYLSAKLVFEEAARLVVQPQALLHCTKEEQHVSTAADTDTTTIFKFKTERGPDRTLSRVMKHITKRWNTSQGFVEYEPM